MYVNMVFVMSWLHSTVRLREKHFIRFIIITLIAFNSHNHNAALFFFLGGGGGHSSSFPLGMTMYFSHS